MNINIHENLKKIKLPSQAMGSNAKTAYIIIIFIISTVLAYGIGRQSVLEHTYTKSVNSSSKQDSNLATKDSTSKNSSSNSNMDSSSEDQIKIIGLPDGLTPSSAGTQTDTNTGTSSQDASAISSGSNIGNLGVDVPNANSGTVFASPRGSKYYLPWCSGGKTLKDKIYFKTEQEAIAKGYTKSSTCK